MRRLALLAVCAALPLLAPAACAGEDAAPPRTVVTTISQIADAVRHVAGDRADVRALMGEGVDPHLYKPTRSDIATMRGADIVFYNGLHLEGKMTDALERLAESGKPVFAVTEGIDQSSLLTPPEFQGAYDPHVWMDPTAWKQAVLAVRDRLTEMDPDAAGVYAANADAYLARLDAIDAYARRALHSVPESQRVMVTAHDAFNYFGRQYGFEVLGIQGISTESEAGVREIERLVDVLVTRRIPAVFVETTVSERNVNALIAGARARGHEVRIGGSLYSDAMGPPGTYEGTYIGMIDHNVTTVARALGGDAPPRGAADSLATGGD